MRDATATKFAAMTTAMRRSMPCRKLRTSKAPVVQALGQRLSQREGRELRVLPFGIEQRLALLAEQHLLDLPEEDGVRAVHEMLHHAAVERHQRIDEHRRSGGEARPVAGLEAAFAAL